MSYYLAPSLEVLRAEINQRWPGRDRTSDGWIGDPAHQATRSDHNPNSRGSVNALDVDEDGIDVPTVFAAIRRHPSARYVIYERRLYHRLRGWKAEPYDGVNPHDKHFHLSIDQTRAAEQDRRPWGLLEDDMSPEEARRAAFLGVYDALYQAASGSTREGRFMALQVAKLAGANVPDDVDDVDEAQIVAGVLAGLTPEKIAAAIPSTIARQVADELAARLAE